MDNCLAIFILFSTIRLGQLADKHEVFSQSPWQLYMSSGKPLKPWTTASDAITEYGMQTTNADFLAFIMTNHRSTYINGKYMSAIAPVLPFATVAAWLELSVKEIVKVSFVDYVVIADEEFSTEDLKSSSMKSLIDKNPTIEVYMQEKNQTMESFIVLLTGKRISDSYQRFGLSNEQAIIVSRLTVGEWLMTNKTEDNLIITLINMCTAIERLSGDIEKPLIEFLFNQTDLHSLLNDRTDKALEIIYNIPLYTLRLTKQFKDYNESERLHDLLKNVSSIKFRDLKNENSEILKSPLNIYHLSFESILLIYLGYSVEIQDQIDTTMKQYSNDTNYKKLIKELETLLSNEAECIEEKCECIKGYFKLGDQCANYNECQDKPCHRSAMCVDTQGSFRCECYLGYFGDGILECRKPCQECPLHSQCVNDECRCVEGYSMLEDSRCVFDNCSICHSNASCAIQKDNNINCTCNVDFIGNGTHCRPNDEQITTSLRTEELTTLTTLSNPSLTKTTDMLLKETVVPSPNTPSFAITSFSYEPITELHKSTLIHLKSTIVPLNSTSSSATLSKQFSTSRLKSFSLSTRPKSMSKSYESSTSIPQTTSEKSTFFNQYLTTVSIKSGQSKFISSSKTSTLEIIPTNSHFVSRFKTQKSTFPSSLTKASLSTSIKSSEPLVSKICFEQFVSVVTNSSLPFSSRPTDNALKITSFVNTSEPQTSKRFSIRTSLSSNEIKTSESSFSKASKVSKRSVSVVNTASLPISSRLKPSSNALSMYGSSTTPRFTTRSTKQKTRKIETYSTTQKSKMFSTVHSHDERTLVLSSKSINQMIVTSVKLSEDIIKPSPSTKTWLPSTVMSNTTCVDCPDSCATTNCPNASACFELNPPRCRCTELAFVLVNNTCMTGQLILVSGIKFNSEWRPELGDITSSEFTELAFYTEDQLTESLTDAPGFLGAKTVRFSKGSVIANALVVLRDVSAINKVGEAILSWIAAGKYANVDSSTLPDISETNACDLNEHNCIKDEVCLPRDGKGYQCRFNQNRYQHLKGEDNDLLLYVIVAAIVLFVLVFVIFLIIVFIVRKRNRGKAELQIYRETIKIENGKFFALENYDSDLFYTIDA